MRYIQEYLNGYKTMFQSPRSGKFVSDIKFLKEKNWKGFSVFQSPRSGKFVSDNNAKFYRRNIRDKFQSPRSGKFVSDEENKMTLEEKIELFQSPRSGEFVSNIKIFLKEKQ